MQVIVHNSPHHPSNHQHRSRWLAVSVVRRWLPVARSRCSAPLFLGQVRSFTHTELASRRRNAHHTDYVRLQHTNTQTRRFFDFAVAVFYFLLSISLACVFFVALSFCVCAPAVYHNVCACSDAEAQARRRQRFVSTRGRVLDEIDKNL